MTVDARRLVVAGGQPVVASTTATDPAGGFALDLEAGDYLIEASDASHAATVARVGLANGAPASLTLTTVPGGSVRGRVVDIRGAPLAGASVTVQGEIPAGTIAAGWHPAAARSAGDGEFTLRGLRPGPLRLTAHLAGFRDAEPVTLFLPLGGRREDVVLALDRGLELAGTVRDRSPSARPLAGVTVEAVDVLTGTSLMAAGPSGADGRFALAGLAPGAVLLDVPRPQALPLWTEARAALPRDAAGPFVVAVDPAFTVEGTPGPGRIVTLEHLADPSRDPGSSTVGGAAVAADAAGHAAFRGVPAGKFALHARGLDGTCAEGSVEVTDHDVRDVAFEPSVGGSITGVVRDGGGQPMAGARVEIASAALSAAGWRNFKQGSLAKALAEAIRTAASQHLETRQETTAADGSFRATCLAPGDYELTAYLGDRPLDWKDPAQMGGPYTPMTVSIASPGARADLTLDVQACAGTVMGKLLDRSGSPKPGAWVAAFAPSGSPTSPADAAMTGPSGSYRLNHLCPGRYQLVARALDDGTVAVSSSPLDLTARGMEDVPLQLDQPASVQGTVKGAGGALIKSFSLLVSGPELWAHHVTNADGAFSEPWLAPGTYDVIVEAPEGYQIDTVAVQPGEKGQIPFEIVPWSSVIGTVTDERGAPVAGLQVQVLFEPAGGEDKRREAWPTSERFRATRTDASGRFAFERVIARRGRLTFGASGAERFVISVANRALPAQPYPRIGVNATPAQGATLDLGAVVVARGGTSK